MFTLPCRPDDEKREGGVKSFWRVHMDCQKEIDTVNECWSCVLSTSLFCRNSSISGGKDV